VVFVGVTDGVFVIVPVLVTVGVIDGVGAHAYIDIDSGNMLN
jgi:hypothetical protein